MYNYADTFFAYLNEGAARSAAAIVPLLKAELRPESVLDVGCGQGAWLRAWAAHGVADISGLDGAYVDRDRLLIPRERFADADLAQPFDLGRRFDLVQSLEVAEHLPPAAAQGFVRSLTAHAPIVLFSAATPGQGGENHINEQWPAYWRNLFGQCGFAMADFVRPRVAHARGIEPWYRYNTFLYIAERALAGVAPAIRDSLVPAGSAAPSMAPWSFRLRSSLLAALPPAAVTRIARAKHRAILLRRRLFARSGKAG